MIINLRCFAGLSKNYQCDFKDDIRVELPEGAMVRNIYDSTGVPDSEVKAVFLNGKIVDAHKKLREGDRVALMPATGGM